MYREVKTAEAVSLPSLIEPSIIKYIDKNASLSSYVNSDNIDIEKSFLYIKNIIKGIDKEKVGVVCPGTILQLTLIASTYRVLEKSSLFSRLPTEKKMLVKVGIDIIDVLIIVLYQFWFLSGKFFIQPSRPRYSEKSAVSTLELLRHEVLLILEEYFEFVKYSKNTSDPSFHEIINQRLIRKDVISTEDIVNKFHPILDEQSFITECGKHGIYTIAYSALCNDINSRMTINYLAQYSSRKPINEATMRLLSRYVEGTSKAYVDIPMIDAMFAAYESARNQIEENPENFMIVVYALLFETIEQILIKHSMGNYFNFSQAENITKSYKVETIVSELVRKPLHVNLGIQKVEQELTEEQERRALQ
jgi:hypothetical protein